MTTIMLLIAAVWLVDSHLTRRRIRVMSQAIDNLTAAVQAEGTVIDSAVALINGLPQLIADAVAAQEAGDTDAVNNLITDIQAKSQALADAVAANTPAAPQA
jgi:hypothetical protein